MKKMMVVTMCLVLFVVGVAPVHAVTIKTANGMEISTEGLSNEEQAEMLRLVEKINHDTRKEVETATDIVADNNTDPTKLNEWRILITDTIKEVCKDLNVGVNEFIKTPVGMLAGGALLYKFAGKEILTTLLKILIIIPGWLVCMGIWGACLRYFFGSKLVYTTISESTDENGKLVKNKTRPEKIPTYPWACSETRDWVGFFFVVCPIIITCMALFAIL